jgi:4'-phosphopantetheinyl transferase
VTEDIGGVPDVAAAGALRAGWVHVWLVGLDVDAASESRLGASLDTDERARAARFHFARDTRRFVVARAALRAILGAYLGEAPASLRFTYGERGKPALGGSAAALAFNLSHSADLAAIAVGWERQLGIDVECRRPLPDLDALAARSFAPAEVTALRALPAGERQAAFYRCWTRKEAFIKATGLGLAQPLHAFTVSLAAGEPARLLTIDGEPATAGRWTLHDVETPASHAGALVVEGVPRGIAVRAWPRA